MRNNGAILTQCHAAGWHQGGGLTLEPFDLSVCVCVCVCVCTKSLQSCLTLCDPMNCSWSCFSIHGILQASILD